MNMLTLLVVLAMLATVTSLAAGITSMTHDGEVGHRTSGQWMVMRVGFQAVAFVLILLSFVA
jgi:hypothetical protein